MSKALRRWRRGGWLAAVGLILQAGVAEACAPFMYEDVVAKGRIRDPHGVWRPARVEASGTHVRIEYAAPSLHGGRLVMIGNYQNDSAALFQLAGPGPQPHSARRGERMSFEHGMARFGLPAYFFQQVSDDAKPLRRVNGLSCRPMLGDHFNPPPAFSLCVHASHIPLVVAGSDGRNVLRFGA